MKLTPLFTGRIFIDRKHQYHTPLSRCNRFIYMMWVIRSSIPYSIYEPLCLNQHLPEPMVKSITAITQLISIPIPNAKSIHGPTPYLYRRSGLVLIPPVDKSVTISPNQSNRMGYGRQNQTLVMNTINVLFSKLFILCIMLCMHRHPIYSKDISMQAFEKIIFFSNRNPAKTL